MTYRSGFFNSVGEDRMYDAEDMGIPFEGIITDGVFKGMGEELIVESAGGLDLIVRTGRSWFDKKWFICTADEPMVAPASNNALSRIDAVVLRVNLAASVRNVTLEYRQGVAASTNPQRPVLTKTADVKEYALAYLDRQPASTTLTAARITNVVGTQETPYAASRLIDPMVDSTWMHRNVVRGKNLGASYTTAQKSAILNGSFEDLYVGDFWEINGHKWRIVDINYFVGYGRAGFNRVTRPHLVVMPDRALRTGQMNTRGDKRNAGAYYGTDARLTQFPAMRTLINNAFGANSLMVWSSVLTTGMSNGYPNNASWVDCSVELPNQVQMLGQSIFSPSSGPGATPANLQSESHTQFALFRQAREFIRVPYVDETSREGVTFTRDILNEYMVAVIGHSGELTYASTDTAWSFRPMFCLHGV